MAVERIDPAADHAAPFLPPVGRARVYRAALRALNAAGVPYVVSGAFAMYHYAGLFRNTKDLDVFIEPSELRRAIDVLAEAGFDVELTDRFWLAKARMRGVLIDLIFAAGNLVAEVDRGWIERARPARVLGVDARLAAPEDLISFKAFICERHRFDGADIAHMIQGLRGKLDWEHLLRRMDGHWELLLVHIAFFLYVYPCHRDYVPEWVLDELVARLRHPARGRRGARFRGTLVSLFSFQQDVEKGYPDARGELRRARSARRRRNGATLGAA